MLSEEVREYATPADEVPGAEAFLMSYRGDGSDDGIPDGIHRRTDKGYATCYGSLSLIHIL